VSAQSPFQQPPAGPAAPAGGGPPPAPTAWWRRAWGVALIALVCAGAGAGVGVAAAGGGGGSPAKTVALAKTVTVTVTSHAAAAAAPTRPPPTTATHAAITRTVTVTVTLPANEPVQTPKGPKTYSGSGRQRIGTLNLPHGAIIHWHASGGHFRLENAAESTDHIELNESGTHGEATTAEGVFPHLEVIASGPWEFTVAPF
jgi:hypothetical protein